MGKSYYDENAFFGQAVGLIYDSAMNDSRWGTALDAVADALGASAMALLVQERQETDYPYGVNALSRVYREFVTTPPGKDYVDRLRRLEAPQWVEVAATPVLRPYLDTASGDPLEELDRREDYVALRRHCNLMRRMVMRLNENRIWSDSISIGFPPELEVVPPEALARLGLLAPHMAKAVELGRMFAKLRERYRAVLSVIDRVGVGLAIALPTGEVIVENAEAQRILGSDDGLALTAGRHLATRDPDLTARLRDRVVTAAAAPRSGSGGGADALVAVQRPSGGTPFLVEICPLTDPEGEVEVSLDGALLKLIDPDRVPDLDVARFARAYGLTGAEEAVAGLILAGHDIEAVAETRNVAPVTVRNQVAATMRKAGCSSRSDLVRLMVRVLPPVR